MRKGPAIGVVVLAATLAACAGRNGQVTDGYPLAASLEARVSDAAVQLTLHVTNVSEQPVPLEFSSAQQYDFVVRRESGETVWSWSAARSFAQVLTSDTVPPGQTRRYTADWNHEGRTGSFVAEGSLLAIDRSVHLAIPLPLDHPAR